MPEQLSAEAYERRRVALVQELGLMDDTTSQEAYDRIARIAKRIFKTEIVLITFIDSERQWFKSHIGTEMSENLRDQSFCTHTIAKGKSLVIEDASINPDFHHNPFVLGGPLIRFYAGEPLVTHDGHPVGTICLFDPRPREFSQEDRDTLRDLAEMVMTQVRLDRDLTYRDAATKMPNRIQFFGDLRDFSRTHEDECQWVVVVELLGMHESNEAVRAFGLGYLYDQIAHAAKILRSKLNNRVIYHVGPTHLAFFLDTQRNVVEFLQAVSSELSAPFITTSGIPAKLDPGCGARVLNTHEIGSPDVLRTLLQAARDARDRRAGVALYDPAADAAQRRAYSLVVEMPRALEKGELYLVYQPRISASSGKISSAEALLRWHHPSLGTVSPGEFLPLISKTPLIRDVTDWVMRSTCKQIAEWNTAGLSICCSFNISARNLEEEDFVNRLVSILEIYGVQPSKLEIELVEDVSVLEDKEALNRLRAIRDLGITIAIDDFGSGYSNLAYLLQLPATVLKLDRSIVAGVNSNPSYKTAVAAVIEMGHELGYKIVAEGIEDWDSSDQLVALGCDVLQGYLFSKPLEVPEFENWIKMPARLGEARS